VAEIDGQVVGFAQFTQRMQFYHPRKFYLSGGVNCDYQGQGIGTGLYNTILEALEEFDPISLFVHARTDRPHAISFLENRGFMEYRREGDSILDPTEFDPMPYLKLERQLRMEGIEIKTLRELESDPHRDRKLYKLSWEINRDAPGMQNETYRDFETFKKEEIYASYRIDDGFFIAVHQGDYIGQCSLMHYAADNSLFHDLTGVRKEYRGRGIALALKVRALCFAQTAGYSLVKTDNEINNRRMLEINERLGFKRLPDWIFFEKIIA